MDKYKISIERVEASDLEGITNIQRKLNQYITAKRLVKYEIHTTTDYVIFNICLLK